MSILSESGAKSKWFQRKYRECADIQPILDRIAIIILPVFEGFGASIPRIFTKSLFKIKNSLKDNSFWNIIKSELS
jgi:hypothetical protein